MRRQTSRRRDVILFFVFLIFFFGGSFRDFLRRGKYIKYRVVTFYI